jgi:Zn-dependent protease
MKWSFKLIKLFGIPIRVHYLFILLLLLVSVLTGLSAEQDKLRQGLIVAGAIMVTFTMVVLHELGHSLVARRYRVRVKDIILLPIGGMARMMDIPRQPRQELLIAVAGPLTSFALAGLFYAVGWLFELLSYQGYAFLVVINLMLGLFNLLPAFPMDGGRILRSLLARRYPFMRATRIAVRVARAIAACGVVGGLYLGAIWFVVISLFIFWGSGAEEKATALSLGLSGRTVGEAMLAGPARLRAGQLVGELPKLMWGKLQEDFPVYLGRKLAGVLSSQRLPELLASSPGMTLYDCMDTKFFVAAPDEPLALVYRRMIEQKVNVVPVLASGRLVGIISPAIVSRFGRLFPALS